MHEIIPNLYLSSYGMIPVNTDMFVINCTKDLPMLNQNNLRIPVNDDRSTEAIDGMLDALPNAVAIIDEKLKNKQPVIVHCLAGQQRSPTVIAAYLIRYHDYTIQDAIEFIRSKKKDAFFWTVNFQETLEKFIYKEN